MKAKKYLEQIKNMDVRINTDIEELAQLEALATKVTSVMGGERVQASGSQQKMADCVIKIADLKNKINKDIDSFMSYKKDARELICAACDADCTSLLYKRYFLFKKWEEIALEMNFTYQWVSGGLHQRALSQVQKVLDEREKENGCK